jgi:phosphatidylcholine synthase
MAWLVHGYTALGLVMAGVVAVLIVHGTESAFRGAFLLMGLAMAVDATDGWLARRVRVEEAIPWFDGRRLDDIIDFHTYTSLPLLLLWRAGVLEGAAAWLLLVPLLASAYGFSRVDAKTEDGYFLGFPSYWNVVAFYLFFLPFPPAAAAATLLAFSALTVVPSRYLAPSRPGPLSLVSNLLGAAWGLLVICFLAGVVEGAAWVVGTLVFPVYYLGASWWVSLVGSRRRERDSNPSEGRGRDGIRA